MKNNCIKIFAYLCNNSQDYLDFTMKNVTSFYENFITGTINEQAIKMEVSRMVLHYGPGGSGPHSAYRIGFEAQAHETAFELTETEYNELYDAWQNNRKRTNKLWDEKISLIIMDAITTIDKPAEPKDNFVL